MDRLMGFREKSGTFYGHLDLTDKGNPQLGADAAVVSDCCVVFGFRGGVIFVSEHPKDSCSWPTSKLCGTLLPLGWRLPFLRAVPGAGVRSRSSIPGLRPGSWYRPGSPIAYPLVERVLQEKEPRHVSLFVHKLMRVTLEYAIDRVMSTLRVVQKFLHRNVRKCRVTRSLWRAVSRDKR